jgi:hypothetical protein
LGSFFLIGPDERLRSFHETASYGSNSAVDSPGAAMSAFEGTEGYERCGGEAPPLTTALTAPDFRIGAEQPSAAVERRSHNEQA